MQTHPKSYNPKGIKYGLLTIADYAVLFSLLLLFRPAHNSNLITGLSTLDKYLIMILYIILRVLPFIVGFLFLITGYSALKGDKTQIFPSIVHGLALAALLTNIFQAFVVFI